MTNVQKDNDLVSKFKDLENQVVRTTENSLKETMIKVFKEYPNTSFTQRNFSEKLGKRTQHINHVLTELRKQNIIVRVGSPKQYYFTLKE